MCVVAGTTVRDAVIENESTVGFKECRESALPSISSLRSNVYGV